MKVKINRYTLEYIAKELAWHKKQKNDCLSAMEVEAEPCHQNGVKVERCTKCGAPFLPHHHKHITRDGVFHTGCYKKHTPQENGGEKKDSWHYCLKCGTKKYGKPKKEDMRGITCMMGDCSWCGKKNITLIPVEDFLGCGD